MLKLFESDAQLQAAIDAVQKTMAGNPDAITWAESLATFLNKVHGEIPSQLLSEGYLKELFDDTTVSSTGNGSVIIAPAMADGEFRKWFHDKVATPLPAGVPEAQSFLLEFHREAKERLKKLCGRTPHLKVNRVFCALYPDFFTTIADQGALTFLHKAMGGSGKDEIVHIHAAIKSRVDQLLGKVTAEKFSLPYCARLSLPWYLYEKAMRELDPDQTSVQLRPTNTLQPLPAVLRRKGLTATKGGFTSLLELLPELQEGLSRTEFEDLVAQRNPGLSKASIGVNINAVAREFDLCRRQGDSYLLTPRGINLLETQDPDELCDHLLTRIFGIDHVLSWLAKEPLAKGKLIGLLQAVHPGWTSTYAPNAQLTWLSSLDVIKVGDDGNLHLTERGRRWFERVTWTPEPLQGEKPPPDVKANPHGKVALPTRSDLVARLNKLVSGRLTFSDALVGQLHAGLWAHPVRHFAVLTGISGSGKTQLALSYANALCGDKVDMNEQVKVIPVQPGWYDPSHLLGYVNPLQEASYRSTPFLDLLLRAADNPTQPHVVILDEMNLSHPEQYLAPILSAMETHGWIELHQLEESQAQVLQRVQFPANLAIVGTVNMDETTHGLSDKVLDRAFTMEFWDIDVAAFPGWSTDVLPAELKGKTRELLIELNKALAPVRMHFGWRTISDVIGYLEFTQQLYGAVDGALDEVVYAKVLPKLRGESSQRFESALMAARDIFEKHGLTRCRIKVEEMRKDLQESGSARFWR